LSLFLLLDSKFICFAQNPSISQIQRAQEVLEKEQALRERLKQKEKIFIYKIIVKGTSLLSEEQVQEIILPFQKRWLTKKIIGEILELIKKAYEEKAYTREPVKIAYQIQKKKLIIEIDESKH
jgi:hemolysin activation/secretion protein